MNSGLKIKLNTELAVDPQTSSFSPEMLFKRAAQMTSLERSSRKPL